MIYKKIWLLVFCSLFVWANVSHTQINENRRYEPIIITGDSLFKSSDTLSFLDYEYKNLYLYAYDADIDSFIMIPFQFDEVDTVDETGTTIYTPEESLDGIFEHQDELVFMTGDLGDKADSSQWMDYMDSVRQEIEFIDPLNGEKGYVYLFYAPDTTFEIPNAYEMDYISNNDRVLSRAYELGFNETGLLGDVIVKPEINGSNVDIFDRFKIRLYGIVNFIIPIPATVTEQAFVADSTWAKIGPVRTIRYLKFHVYIKYGELEFETRSEIMVSYFFPWCGYFGISLPIEDFSSYVDILWTRLSWDMNENAVGMYFYSENNTNGVPVDGTGEHEDINTECKADDLNWAMVTGLPGTFLNVFYVPPLGDSQGIFYFDSNDENPNSTGEPSNFDDWVWDSGDSVAFGEGGYFLSDDDNIDVEQLELIYYNFVLPPEFSPDMASRLTEQLRHPLTYTTQPQYYEPPPSMVEQGISSKYQFVLNQNYPNPFNASTVISFTLSQPGDVSLMIYDILGKQVKEIISERLSDGVHKYNWFGYNDHGQSVPSGLYFYKLKVNNKITTKKLVLVK